MSGYLENAPAVVLRRIEAWERRVDGLAVRLERLVGLTLGAAGRMNLTADRDPALYWGRHIEDGLVSAEAVETAIGALGEQAARILDVGSGAGLPGLIWALIWPAARVDLLEARRKRVEFLREAVAALDLGDRAEVIEGRAESVGHDRERRGRYDLVAARALAPLPVLLELTIPFARVGGSVAAIKAETGLAAEVKEAERALEMLGGGSEPRIVVYSRGDQKQCAVCLIRKERSTPARFPRREGVPKQRPL
jgi:16S rRNA (guanine527-N7)-methyltransferase